MYITPTGVLTPGGPIHTIFLSPPLDCICHGSGCRGSHSPLEKLWKPSFHSLALGQKIMLMPSSSWSPGLYHPEHFEPPARPEIRNTGNLLFWSELLLNGHTSRGPLKQKKNVPFQFLDYEQCGFSEFPSYLLWIVRSHLNKYLNLQLSSNGCHLAL